MNKNKDVVLLRNPNIMLKLIADLLEKAMNKITAEYREEQLKAVKLELEAKTAELASLRESEKGQTYTDEQARRYVEERRKNIADILIPALKDELETLTFKSDTNDAALESVDRLQLQALERIEKLRLDTDELKKAAEERTGEFQAIINDEIAKIASEIEAIELELGTYADKLAELIIKKAELNASSINAKKSIISLESELAELSKTGKFISFKKVIAKAKEDELAEAVDALKKRKKLLATEPEPLAADLTKLIKEGATEDEINEKLATLKALAGEVKIDLRNMPKLGFVAVPSRQTVGELNNQASFYKSNALNLQQNAINNTILISKMVAGIIHYMELINRAKIVKAQLSKDLQTFEKEFTKLPVIRANIKKVEETIARLEMAKNKMLEVLEETVVYNKENAVKQCSSNFMESQAIMGLSQLESKNPNPSAINLENLTIMEALLSGEYQLPSKEKIEESPEELGLTLESGETFSIASNTELEAGQVEDLSSINPNSLGKEATITLEPVRLTTLIEEPETTLPLQIENQVDEKKEEDLPLSGMMESGLTENNEEVTIATEMEKASASTNLVPIPTSEVSAEKAEEIVETDERYVPYNERTGNVIPFRVGTPPSPNPRVLSSRGVSFESRLNDLAIAGVFGNLKERAGYKL
jgi:hypothetical protein